MNLVDIVFQGTPCSGRFLAEKVLRNEVPTNEVPADEVPADEVPADEVPADEVPADEVLADEVLADEVPADEVPAEEPPAPPEEPPALEYELPVLDEFPAEEAAPAEDKMRALVAQYAVSCIHVLRENSDFRRMMHGGGEFVVDLIMALAKGPDIRT